jgi:hypothetical protein
LLDLGAKPRRALLKHLRALVGDLGTTAAN